MSLVEISERITDRAVLYVGLACDLKCRFCYYTYKPAKDRKFRELSWLKDRVGLFANYYGDRAVDITGGEPTIYPEILPLIELCKGELDLQTCVITHGLHLVKMSKQLKSSGLDELLISIHGTDGVHDRLVCKDGAFNLLARGINKAKEAGIYFRTNTVVTEANRTNLPKLAHYLKEIKTGIANFIIFNPFYEWMTDVGVKFQAKHSDIAGPLIEAINVLSEAGIPCNVRYFPFCQLAGKESHVVGFAQLPYDFNEWDFRSWHLFDQDADANRAALARQYFKGQRQDEMIHLGQALIDRKNLYVKGDACRKCAANPICDGFSKQYVARFGMDEARPYLSSSSVFDPLYFKSARRPRRGPRPTRPGCRGVTILEV